jgi:hypothetical protein
VCWFVMVFMSMLVYVCEASVRGCACVRLCCVAALFDCCGNCVMWLRTVDGVTWRRAWHAWMTTEGMWPRVRCRVLVAAGGTRAPCVGCVAVKGVMDGMGRFGMWCRRQGRVGGWVWWCGIVSAAKPAYASDAVHFYACVRLCCLGFDMTIVANCV